MAWTSTLMISIIYVAYQVEGVKITLLSVPSGASHEAPLNCKYDLENAQLYDVKWYKDGLEFFRCRANGSVQVFYVDGVKVEHSGFSNLGSCSVTLVQLDPKSSGRYKCEISTEGPTFKTASESANLKLIQPLRRIQTNESKDSSQKMQQDVMKDDSKTVSGALKIKYQLFILLIASVVHML